MKLITRIAAELVFLFHVFLVLVVLFGWIWEELFFLYGLFLFAAFFSWVFTRGCLLTDIETKLRAYAGQDVSNRKGSFVGYWGRKVFGDRVPSNKVLVTMVLIFYCISVPLWLFNYYIHYYKVW